MKIGPRPKNRPYRTEVVADPPAFDLQCAECGGPMRLLRAVDNETHEVRWLYWGCKRYPVCSCTHSAHADGSPMGKPANAATRRMRHAAHGVFDLLWRGKAHMTRGAAYRWLTEMFGASEQVHIGNMTIEECEQVITWTRKKLTELEQARKTTRRVKKQRGKWRRDAHPRWEERAQRQERHEERERIDSDPPQAPEPEPEDKPPKGRPPGYATVKARYYAACAFERLWRGGLMTEADATEWLRDGGRAFSWLGSAAMP